MVRAIRDHPIWPDLFPRGRRRSFSRLRGSHETEVAIVGAGAAGCAAAYAFAAAGVSVVLLEAETVGRQATATGSGLVLPVPDTGFQVLQTRYGRRASRQVLQLVRRSSLDLAATLRRLRVACQLDTQDLVTVTAHDRDVPALRRELTARRTAGVDATWLTADRVQRLSRLSAGGGIRSRGASQLDPYRMCVGFLSAAVSRGAMVFERSPVTKIRPDRQGVEITAGAGTVRAGRVVVATSAAGPLFKPLSRHTRVTQTYRVLTGPLDHKLRRQLGPSGLTLTDTADPRHLLRWTRDHRVLFSGADQADPSRRSLDKILMQRRGQLMYELSTIYPPISGVQPEYAWASPVVSTVDGLPLVGPHRNYPHHLFALALGHNSLTNAFLASRVLLRHHLGTPDKADALFGFTR